MKTKGFSKKILSLVLAGSITIGMTSALSGCGSKKDEVVTLDVYNMLANYSGMQTGWIADILKEKFNVRLNIIPDGSGVYETRMESGDLGDIIVWGADADRYANAVKGGLLYDWNEDDILTEFGSYIKEKMPDAIAKNQGLTKELTNGEKDCLYGIGNDVATSNKDHQMFIYNWDVRWDLYKQLGYPKVKDMDGMLQLMKDMQKLCLRMIPVIKHMRYLCGQIGMILWLCMSKRQQLLIMVMMSWGLACMTRRLVHIMMH